MKKISTFAIAVLFVLCAISTSVFAEDPVSYYIPYTPVPFTEADARNVGDDVRELLGVSENDLVIRCFNTLVYLPFGTNTTIEEIFDRRMNEGMFLQPEYIIRARKGSIAAREGFAFEIAYITDEKKASFCRHESNRSIKEYVEGKAIRRISEDIEIENVYYFDGTSTHSGRAIYYVTDYGDYVYYENEFTGELLFPSEVFFSVAHDVEEEVKKHPDWFGGVDISSLCDLSPYDLNSETFSVQPTVIPIKAEVSADVIAPAVETPNEIAPAATESGNRALVIAVVLTAALVALAATVVFTQYRKKKIG